MTCTTGTRPRRRLLVDAQFRGAQRKLMLQGIATASSTCSTAHGQGAAGRAFVRNIYVGERDRSDGRPKLLPENEPTVEGRRSCPAVAGAANWTSTAFSQSTGLFYMFAEESCTIYSKER